MLIHSIKEVRKEIKIFKEQKKSIGLVPTMGYLHLGHLSLIEKAHQENDIVVVSVFVNPTQFGPNEDYESYPRDIKKDYELATKHGADIIFNPSPEEMYPEKIKTYVEVQELTENLCGISRPTHFKGVTTVVSKLFNIVDPERAYFGQKDAQQVAIVKRMVKDLNFDIDIIVCPIIREEDGLAMSSRNYYLNTEERSAALRLSESLFKSKTLIQEGEINCSKITDYIQSCISQNPLCKVDYVKIVDPDNLTDLQTIKNKALIALAVFVGKTRLIDNIIVEVPSKC